jgi:sugar/nucleoside kinase (ribokinase family)
VLCCLGDLCEDVVIWPTGPLAHGSDTTATIVRRRGGSAANVAVFAAAVGCRSRFLGCVGDDPIGHQLMGQLRQHGVEVDVQTGLRTGSIVVLVGVDGERTMITDKGCSTELNSIPPAWLEGCTWLHVPFYSFEIEPLAQAARSAARWARQRGIPVSVDASSAALLAAYGVDRVVAEVGLVDVLFANADEAEVLAGRWPATVTVVKRGAAPAQVIDSEGTTEVAVPTEVVVRDTTGAGDAFAAGFIAARLEGADPVAAARAGHRLAARVLGSAGATLA